MRYSDDHTGFVLLEDAVPGIKQDIRYFSSFNFIGERIDGYEEPAAILTKEAAAALQKAAVLFASKGYGITVFDAYRPQKAVDHFVRWAGDPDDVRMKEYFYPFLDKKDLLPGGYIAAHSGHSRGSTVDLTLYDLQTGEDLDMGGPFDFFGELSHPDYKGISPEQYACRMVLREGMTACGFRPLAEEWWHFTLRNEPYPDTYFTFPVSNGLLRAHGQ